jgi:rhodanese-related sulfurtransferase
MLTDGVLLRLARAKFHKFIKDAIIAHLSLEAAQQMNDQELVWLDVRHSEAFEQGHLAGSTNIPFFSLRMMLPTLDRNKQYLLICDTGHLSEAAAFLLIRHEFSAYVLTDGLRNIPADQLIKGTNPTNSSSSLACEEKTEFPVSTSGFTHAASRNLDEAWKTLSPSDEIPRGSELQGSETQSPKSPMEAEPTAQNLTTPNAVEPKTTASPPSSETIVAKFIEIDSETAFEELEFLPTQPDAETLKARLRDAEAEIKRLRGECEGLKYKLIGAENSLRTPLPEVHQKSSLLSELVRSLIIAFILTALILAGLLIFSPGQELLKQWLA